MHIADGGGGGEDKATKQDQADGKEFGIVS
jgi:hypothetical protein